MAESWVKKQRELLELESTSEESQLLQKISSLPAKVCEQEGLSIVGLNVVNVRTELFGRCCVELQKIAKIPLPPGLKVGDEVTLLPSSSESDDEEDVEEGEICGLIRSCSNLSIEVVLEEYDPKLTHPPIRINLRSSMTTHRRMMDALNQLQAASHPLFYHVHAPAESSNSPPMYLNNDQVVNWYNSGLNSSQKEAIECCINSSLISIVHGPPGTGKTSTLVELILQSVQRNKKLLVCAPSNIAVDTILQRVAMAVEYQAKDKGKSDGIASKCLNRMVRIGHPARIHSSILKYTLDHHIAHDEGTQIVRDIHEEIQSIRNKLQKNTKRSSKPSGEPGQTKKELRAELRQIRKEANTREKQVVKQILSNAMIVFSTCVGAASSLLKEMEFDMTIIDEAAQGIEAACWIPILKSNSCVLAGDHCQLPPTIKNEQAAREGLQVTLFERIIQDNRFSSFCKLLKIQYRMNDIINQWASNQMYGGQVVSDESVANHTLNDLITSAPNPEEETVASVALFIDTSDERMYEESASETTAGNASHRNVHEAYIVLQHCLYLVQLGIQCKDIGIITPYNGQLQLLKQVFQSYVSIHLTEQLLNIEIKTIDGFQGGEKECIILCLVRSNDKRNVGFLSEKRRMNVAITRAKRHVAIIGDTITCKSDEFIGSLIDHVEAFGDIIPYSLYNEFYYPPILDNLDIERPKAAPIPSVATSKSKKSKINAPNVTKTKSQSVTRVGTSDEDSSKSIALKKKPAGDQGIDEKNAEARTSEFLEILTKYKDGEIFGGILQCEDTANRQVNKSLLSYSHLTVSKNGDIAKQRDFPLRFPSQLNSYERMLIHSIASDLQLSHQSITVGEARFIEVSKTIMRTESTSALPVVAEVSKNNDPAKNDDHNTGETLKNESQFSTKVGAAPPLPQKNESNKAVQPNKKDKKTKNSDKSGGNKKQDIKLDNALDEDALLELAIQQNRELAAAHKYRIGSTPLLNPEKEASKQKLKAKLQEVQDTRKTAFALEEAQNGNGGHNRKKVVKKPVPNFGGGKVGSK